MRRLFGRASSALSARRFVSLPPGHRVTLIGEETSCPQEAELVCALFTCATTRSADTLAAQKTAPNNTVSHEKVRSSVNDWIWIHATSQAFVIAQRKDNQTQTMLPPPMACILKHGVISQRREGWGNRVRSGNNPDLASRAARGKICQRDLESSVSRSERDVKRLLERAPAFSFLFTPPPPPITTHHHHP